MDDLRIENRDKVLEIIQTYSNGNGNGNGNDNELDYEFIINEIYGIVTEEIDKSIHFDLIVERWQTMSGQTRYATEEEIFHIISIEIEKEIRSSLLEEVENIQLEEVDVFLLKNYKMIFKNYYDKHQNINEDDFDDCVISVSKNFEIEEGVADVFVSMFVEKEILKITI